MKFIAIIGIAILLMLCQNIFGQCNVEKDVTDEEVKYYLHSNENIYKNEDLIYGIMTAYVQLGIIQNSKDNKLLQSLMFVLIGEKDKEMVVPRKIEIYFTDGTSDQIMAESLGNPYTISEVSMQQGTFVLTKDNYLKLQEKSVSKIVIIDHRNGNELVCTPYMDLLKEQANCIVSSLD